MAARFYQYKEGTEFFFCVFCEDAEEFVVDLGRVAGIHSENNDACRVSLLDVCVCAVVRITREHNALCAEGMTKNLLIGSRREANIIDSSYVVTVLTKQNNSREVDVFVR